MCQSANFHEGDLRLQQMTACVVGLQLAAPADLYVNDAFGSAHRAHASTEGVTHYLSPNVAGFLMKKVPLPPISLPPHLPPSPGPPLSCPVLAEFIFIVLLGACCTQQLPPLAHLFHRILPLNFEEGEARKLFGTWGSTRAF